jgi:hypothetical protein
VLIRWIGAALLTLVLVVAALELAPVAGERRRAASAPHGRTSEIVQPELPDWPEAESTTDARARPVPTR